ncbi:TPA: hypothetical protein ACH3X1_005289 [Trebouxia sp. C0004]
MLRSCTRRGRAPANNSEVLAMFRLVYSGEGATQPLVDDASLTKHQKWQLLFDRNWRNLAPSSQTKWLVYVRKWKVMPLRSHERCMLVCCSEEADPSCSASTLSNEEYASLLDAAMRFFDKQMIARHQILHGVDLQRARQTLAMQILALANNAGKANQDAQMTYAALANHRQPHLDCLAYLSQLVLYQLNVSKLPLLALIHQNNTSWRSYRMFFRDPSMATSKQTYYDLSTMLLKVAATMPDTLVKTKIWRCHTMVMHLMRCSGTVSLAAAACSMDVLRV